MDNFHFCSSFNNISVLYKLFKRHSIEIIGNFVKVPFLLFINAVSSYVNDAGNRTSINERGNGYAFAELCWRCCFL